MEKMFNVIFGINSISCFRALMCKYVNNL